MAITLASNIASLRAAGQLGETTRSLAVSLQRLSSGLRINSASDDPAGLAVVTALESKEAVYRQGLRNLNDGISMFSLAEAAFGELKNISTRIAELAGQAANGSYTSVQRQALDQEAQALRSEYFRVARSVEYNGLNPFDGSLTNGISIQDGFGASGALQLDFGGILGTGEFLSAVSISGEVAGDLNGDGNIDLVALNAASNTVEVRYGNGSGGFSTSVSFAAGILLDAATQEVLLADFNNDGNLDILAAEDYAQGVLLGDGAGGFSAAVSNSTTLDSASIMNNSIAIGDLNGDGLNDLVIYENNGIGPSYIGTAYTYFGNGDGTFSTESSFEITNTASAGTRSQLHSVALADMDSDGILDLVSYTFDDTTGTNGMLAVRLGTGNGGFSVAADFSVNVSSPGLGDFSGDFETKDLDGDGNLDVIVADGQDIYVYSGLGDGSLSLNGTYAYSGVPALNTDISIGDLNGDGLDDVVVSTDNGTTHVLLAESTGVFGSPTNYLGYGEILADVNNDGVYDLIGDSGGILASTRSGVAPLLDFSLLTSADAKQAIGILEHNFDNLSLQQGQLGAMQSRLEVASSNLFSLVDNISFAASRIRDVDSAKEVAELVRLQVLQQAGVAILAQANLLPRLALTLLGSLDS